MNLSYYQPTELEKWIVQQYKRNGIKHPWQMDIEHIASIFRMRLTIYDGACSVEWDDDGRAHIFLDENEAPCDQREIFFHEICHPLRHVGNQDEMPESFRELQEIQASIFQLYAAMPYFMLYEFNTIQLRSEYIKTLSDEFNLSIPFIEKRIAQVERRIYQGQVDEQYRARRSAPKPEPEYSFETNKIINQLYRQLKKQYEEMV